MNYFEDLRVGQRDLLGEVTFTAEMIKSYAARFDPQHFHMDEEAAAKSHFGALCASGWQTAALWMKHMLMHRRAESEARRARGEPVAKNGPSPGIKELRWLKPVYVGDTISFASEIVELRRTLRAGWGLMVVRNTATNQNGDLVLSFIGQEFIERRPQPEPPG